MAAASLSCAALAVPAPTASVPAVSGSVAAHVRAPRGISRSEFCGARLVTVASRKVPARPRLPSRCQVAVGDSVPDVTLVDQNGKAVSLAKLKGKNVVLYFYPADDTPGCTKQACSFRDAFEVFRDLGAEVVGISGDSPESHKKFAEKYDLPYRLLSDEGNEVRKEFGIPADLFGFLPGRQTYVIDKKGVVQLIFNNQFQPEKHIEETVKLLEELKDDDSSSGFKLPNFPKLELPKLF